MNDRISRRLLGKSGLTTSALALGCYSMSNSYGARTDSESVQVIQAAVDGGIDLIDTADFYGWGHNERLVGTALRGRRSQVVLSSKFGFVRGAGGALGLCSEPAHVLKSCHESLQRLGTDHIDLYFQHRLDPRVPIEDTVGAMAALVEQGKVRYLGLCEVSDQTLKRACAVHPITAVQSEYSLWSREIEDRLLPACGELGVTPMAFSPLGRGMLTGALRSLDQLEPDDVRRRYPRFSAENFPKNLALIDRFGAIAKTLGRSNSQLALAWLLAKDPALVAVCGADTLPYLKENFEAMKTPLDPDTVDALDEIFAPGLISGDRYGPAGMTMLDRS